jgi:hypothetical protein
MNEPKRSAEQRQAERQAALVGLPPKSDLYAEHQRLTIKMFEGPVPYARMTDEDTATLAEVRRQLDLYEEAEHGADLDRLEKKVEAREALAAAVNALVYEYCDRDVNDEYAALMFDPIKHEKKPLTMQDFARVLRGSVTRYVDDLDQQNDYTKDAHTFDEWMAHFARYMSF